MFIILESFDKFYDSVMRLKNCGKKQFENSHFATFKKFLDFFEQPEKDRVADGPINQNLLFL